MDAYKNSAVECDNDSINNVKLKPKDFTVVIRELDIGSNKLIGLPHPIVFIPLGQVVPDLSLEAPRYLRVALGYSIEPGNTWLPRHRSGCKTRDIRDS